MQKDENGSILLTGGTSGIGYQATLNLIEKDYSVIVLCRNQARADHLRKLLENDNISQDRINHLLTSPIVNLSDFDSINSFADNFIKQKINVNSFVFNAGLQYTGSKKIRRSAQNIELTIAINHLSHHLLIQRLLPTLLQSKSPRVVITSSEVHNPQTPGGKIGKSAALGELSGIQRTSDFFMIDDSSTFDADKAYKDSKLCNILFAKELSRRLEAININIPIICWAPGLVIPKNRNGFFRHSRKYNELGQIAFAFIARDLLRITETPKKAGKILMDLTVSDRYLSQKFIFISNKIKRLGEMVLEESNISEEAQNKFKAKRLWELSNLTIAKFIDSKLFL